MKFDDLDLKMRVCETAHGCSDRWKKFYQANKGSSPV